MFFNLIANGVYVRTFRPGRRFQALRVRFSFFMHGSILSQNQQRDTLSQFNQGGHLTDLILFSHVRRFFKERVASRRCIRVK